jgi:hypothetical protein
MFKLTRGTLTITGNLKSFNAGEEKLFLTFVNGEEIEIPNVKKDINVLMSKVGLAKIKNSTIDLNTNDIRISE